MSMREIGAASPMSPVAPLTALLGPSATNLAAAAAPAAAAPIAPHTQSRVHFAPSAVQHAVQQTMAPAGGAQAAVVQVAVAPANAPIATNPAVTAGQQAGFNTLRGTARGVTPLQIKATLFSEAACGTTRPSIRS